MLILSKFRDYYDKAVGLGIDKTIVFERKQGLHKGKAFKGGYWIGDGLPSSQKGCQLNSFREPMIKYFWYLVGFCGKTYVLCERCEALYNATTWPMSDKESTFYYGNVILALFADKKDVIRVKKFLDEWHERDKPEVFLEYKTPYYIEYYGYVSDRSTALHLEEDEYQRNGNSLLTIPILKNWDFYKVKDPYTAFQEIMMYISGVLGVGERPMVPISDTDRLKQHGFDTKQSFRGPEQTKRPKTKKK